MANYKIVDADILDANLASVAESIRQKGNSTSELNFPDDFVSVLDSINTAKEEQEKVLDVTANGSVEVNPDDGKVLSKVTVNVEVASETDVNGVLNDLGSGTLDLKVFNFSDETFRGYYAFVHCNFEEVYILNAKSIPGSCFEDCSQLTKVVMDSVEVINDAAFALCSSLRTVVINTPTIPTFEGENIFSSTPLETYDGGIYVPDDLVDSYYEVTNIAHLPIYPISELAEVV